MNTILLIDSNALCMRLLHRPEVKQDIILSRKWGLWKYHVFQELFKGIHKIQPDEVVLAWDSPAGYWRKDIYPEYKQKRKANYKKMGEELDMAKFWQELDLLKNSIFKYFPFISLEVSKCEADDIIGVLAKRLVKDKTVIFASDKDFQQLLKYHNTTMFDPIKLQYVKCEDPERYLQTQILIGDASDTIPNVKNKSKIHFEEGMKTIPFGPKGAEKCLDDEKLMTALKEGFGVNIERNRKLIDLEQVPTEYENQIRAKYYFYRKNKGFHNNGVLYFRENFLPHQEGDGKIHRTLAKLARAEQTIYGG